MSTSDHQDQPLSTILRSVLRSYRDIHRRPPSWRRIHCRESIGDGRRYLWRGVRDRGIRCGHPDRDRGECGGEFFDKVGAISGVGRRCRTLSTESVKMVASLCREPDAGPAMPSYRRENGAASSDTEKTSSMNPWKPIHKVGATLIRLLCRKTFLS